MEHSLSLLARFDDVCRFSQGLFESQNDQLPDMLMQSERNRLSWLDLKNKLYDANQKIKVITEYNVQMEGKLKRLRAAFGMQARKSEEKDKEIAKLRNTVNLIRECIKDDHRFTNQGFKGGSHRHLNSPSSNSDYHSGSYRDLIHIINNSDEYMPKASEIGLNRRIISENNDSPNSSDEELQFDKTEDDLQISRTNLVPSGDCFKPSAPPISEHCPAKPNRLSRISENTYSVGTLKRPNSPSAGTTATYTVTINEQGTGKDGPTESKYSRNIASISPTTNNSVNHYGDNEDSNCQENEHNEAIIDAEKFKLSSDAALNDQTNFMTPMASISSPILRPATGGTIESRRLNRCASVKKIKIDLSRLDNRPHNLTQKKNFKGVYCVPCGKSIGFCSNYLTCNDCYTTCHPSCHNQLSLPCIPHYTPKAISRSGLSFLKIGDFVAPDTRPFVPPLLVHCCKEIEARGLDEEGIYRKCGSDKEVRELKKNFLHSKTGALNIRNIDVHVLCGVVKMFLRDLSDPLITRVLWHDFIRAIDISAHGKERSTELLKRSVDELPEANRDTLAFVILHLKRVAACEETKMTISSLASIFGPTIIGNASLNQFSNSKILALNEQQNRTMEALLELPTNYWEEILHQPDVYDTPQAKVNGNLRKFAATTGGGKSMHAMSPYSYRSATSSVYGTPAGVNRLREKFPPTKLFLAQ